MTSPSSSDPDDPPPFENEREFANYLDVLQDVKAEINVELAVGNYSRVKNDAMSLLKKILPENDATDKTRQANKLNFSSTAKSR